MRVTVSIRPLTGVGTRHRHLLEQITVAQQCARSREAGKENNPARQGRPSESNRVGPKLHLLLSFPKMHRGDWSFH